MSYKEKVTKGSFKIDRYGTIKNENGKTLLAYGMAIPMGIVPGDECSSNSMLIAESFNVLNESGLTPRELLEQRDELADALKIIVATFGRDANIQKYQGIEKNAIKIAKNTLAEISKITSTKRK